jgi:hypothetical protein
LSLLKFPGRIPRYGGIVRHIANDDCAGANDGIRAYLDSLSHDRTDAEPRSRTYLDISGEVRSRADVHRLRQQAIVIHGGPRVDDACLARSHAHIDARARDYDRSLSYRAMRADGGGRMNDRRAPESSLPCAVEQVHPQHGIADSGREDAECGRHAFQLIERAHYRPSLDRRPLGNPVVQK